MKSPEFRYHATVPRPQPIVASIALFAVLLLGCAGTSGERAVPAAHRGEPAVYEVVSPAREGEPEIVRMKPLFKLGYRAAFERYAKGARCNGSDAPETVVGKPDQRNELEVARDRIVTYGFRFPEGTLLIRCRRNVVETSRMLK